MDVTIKPKKLQGQVRAISSKSHAHRILVSSFLAGDDLSLDNIDLSLDIKTTFDCLNALKNNDRKINCKESGSTLRFLLPVILALGKSVKVCGEGRLPDRPLSPFIEELTSHGASFSNKTLPFCVSGKIESGNYTLPGNISSQFISGLLFALPILKGDSEIKIEGEIQSKAYIDLTIKTLEDFSVKIEKTENGYFIKGSQVYKKNNIVPEGDWSNASVFLAMDALGADIDVLNLNESSIQADRKIIELLVNNFGAQKCKSEGIKVKTDKGINPVKIDVSQFPDLFPVLAVLSCGAKGKSLIYNAKRLRIKESDRIKSTALLIKSLGGMTIEHEDSLEIFGSGYLLGGEVNSFNDHRIVMAAALASLICKDKITIKNAQAINKSYPNFFKDFKNLGGIADVSYNGK